MSELRLIDTETGEVLEPGNYQDALAVITQLRKRLQIKGAALEDRDERIAKLKGDHTTANKKMSKAAVSSERHGQVLEVLLYWRPKCMPGAKIVPASPRWQKVDEAFDMVDENGDPAYTVQELKNVVDGALRSDYHVQNDYLDAETLFRDQGTIERHRSRLPDRERPSVLKNGLALNPDLKQRLAKLRPSEFGALDRCDCGHPQFLHAKRLDDGPMLGWWPCTDVKCNCLDFDDLEQRADQWVREQRSARDRGHKISEVAEAAIGKRAA